MSEWCVPDEDEAASVASGPSLQGSLWQNIQEDVGEEDYKKTQKGIKSSSYTAQYPVLRIGQSAFTLYFPDRSVQSNTISTSLGSLNVQRLLVHISTIVYSQVLVYTAE